jgi:hypothetical protein
MSFYIIFITSFSNIRNALQHCDDYQEDKLRQLLEDVPKDCKGVNYSLLTLEKIDK